MSLTTLEYMDMLHRMKETTQRAADDPVRQSLDIIIDACEREMLLARSNPEQFLSTEAVALRTEALQQTLLERFKGYTENSRRIIRSIENMGIHLFSTGHMLAYHEIYKTALHNFSENDTREYKRVKDALETIYQTATNQPYVKIPQIPMYEACQRIIHDSYMHESGQYNQPPSCVPAFVYLVWATGPKNQTVDIETYKLSPQHQKIIKELFCTNNFADNMEDTIMYRSAYFLGATKKSCLDAIRERNQNQLKFVLEIDPNIEGPVSSEFSSICEEGKKLLKAKGTAKQESFSEESQKHMEQILAKLILNGNHSEVREYLKEVALKEVMKILTPVLPAEKPSPSPAAVENTAARQDTDTSPKENNFPKRSKPPRPSKSDDYRQGSLLHL